MQQVQQHNWIFLQQSFAFLVKKSSCVVAVLREHINITFESMDLDDLMDTLPLIFSLRHSMLRLFVRTYHSWKPNLKSFPGDALAVEWPWLEGGAVGLVTTLVIRALVLVLIEFATRNLRCTSSFLSAASASYSSNAEDMKATTFLIIQSRCQDQTLHCFACNFRCQ